MNSGASPSSSTAECGVSNLSSLGRGSHVHWPSQTQRVTPASSSTASSSTGGISASSRSAGAGSATSSTAETGSFLRFERFEDDAASLAAALVCVDTSDVVRRCPAEEGPGTSSASSFARFERGGGGGRSGAGCADEDAAAVEAERGPPADSGGSGWGSAVSGDGEPDDFDVAEECAERRFERRGSLAGAMGGGGKAARVLVVRWAEGLPNAALTATLYTSDRDNLDAFPVTGPAHRPSESPRRQSLTSRRQRPLSLSFSKSEATTGNRVARIITVVVQTADPETNLHSTTLQRIRPNASHTRLYQFVKTWRMQTNHVE